MTTAATTTRTAIIAISDIFRSAIQVYFALLPIKINGNMLTLKCPCLYINRYCIEILNLAYSSIQFAKT